MFEKLRTATAAKKLVGIGGTRVQQKRNTGSKIHFVIVVDPFGNYIGPIEGA